MSPANIAGWIIMIVLIVGGWATLFYAYWRLAGWKVAIIVMGGATLLLFFATLAAYLINL